MTRIILTDRWRELYPGASIGTLAMRQVSNQMQNVELDQEKEAMEMALRQLYAGYDRQTLRSLPTLKAYQNYYKRFKKSYHVQLQLESVAIKGKPIPKVASLVESMFMAELKNQLLTAGHNQASVVMPVRIDVATGNEHYVRLNQQEQKLKKGDMYIADSEGVLSSVIYGPDLRTRITADTSEALFTVYAPNGINPKVVQDHLRDIETYVRLSAPAAITDLVAVYEA